MKAIVFGFYCLTCMLQNIDLKASNQNLQIILVYLGSVLTFYQIYKLRDAVVNFQNARPLKLRHELFHKTFV